MSHTKLSIRRTIRMATEPASHTCNAAVSPLIGTSEVKRSTPAHGQRATMRERERKTEPENRKTETYQRRATGAVSFTVGQSMSFGGEARAHSQRMQRARVGNLQSALLLLSGQSSIHSLENPLTCGLRRAPAAVGNRWSSCGQPWKCAPTPIDL